MGNASESTRRCSALLRIENSHSKVPASERLGKMWFNGKVAGFFAVLAWDEALAFPDTTMPLNGVLYRCGARTS
jgi:hypothetical protein